MIRRDTYVDGYSLYAGYFIPNTIDPSGLSSCVVWRNHTFTLNTAGCTRWSFIPGPVLGGMILGFGHWVRSCLYDEAWVDELSCSCIDECDKEYSCSEKVGYGGSASWHRERVAGWGYSGPPSNPPSPGWTDLTYMGSGSSSCCEDGEDK